MRIGLDISLIFKIDSGDDMVRSFVYNLGAARMDELLSAEVEEGVRNFVNGVRITDVQDLKGDMAQKMLSELNQRFARFGVHFERCNIPQLHIPPKLLEALQSITKFKVETQTQVKQHNNDVLTLENEENQKMAELQRENIKTIQIITAKKDRALIEREEKEIQANSNFSVRVTKAEEDVTVEKTKAEGNKAIAESKAQASVVEMVNKETAPGQARKIDADERARISEIEAKALVDATRARYEALVKEGKAELAQASAYAAKRDYQVEMARAEVYEKLGRQSGKLVFTGQNSDDILKALVGVDKK